MEECIMGINGNRKNAIKINFLKKEEKTIVCAITGTGLWQNVMY